jgi:hypothetical protein
MSGITLVKRTDELPSDAKRLVLREALFDMIDGLSEQDQKSWRRFWNRIVKLGSGEILQIDTWIPRHGGFHRRHMKIESSVFQAQERIKTFEQFRYWLKLGAGFVNWMPGPKGGVVPVPRTISFKECDEDTMRAFHQDSIEFLKSAHACKYLWPALSPIAAGQAMDAVLSRFDE